ncbi:MAG: MMPL family transporter, partial [Gammaproteobacteria bacterium]|nr:MMPL family transporter [Gammaproteobacteria bacterium]
APLARFDFNPLNLKDPTTDAVAAFRDLAADPDTSPYVIHVLAPDLNRARALAARLEELDAVDKALTLASYVPGDQELKLEIIDGMRLALTGVLPATDTAAPAAIAEEAAGIEAFHQRLAEAQSATREPAVVASMARLDRALSALQSVGGWPDKVIPSLRRNLLGDLPETLTRLEQALEAGPVSLEDLPVDLRTRYVSADGRARVEVFPRADLNDNAALAEFVRAVQSVAPDATDSPVELLEAGDAVIRSCIQATAIALVLGMLMNVIVLRSAAGALLAAVPLLLALLFTVATSVLFDAPLNFANIIALPLMIGLSNAYGVYLVIRRQSTADMAQLLGTSTPRAVLLSGLTTIASFGTLGFATHPGMAGMGILIALALVFALVSSLVVLPAIMAIFEMKR